MLQKIDILATSLIVLHNYVKFFPCKLKGFKNSFVMLILRWNFGIVFYVRCVNNIWRSRLEYRNNESFSEIRYFGISLYRQIYASTRFRPLISSAIYRASRQRQRSHQMEFCIYTRISPSFSQRKANGE